MNGKLYLCATPIGNLGDVSARCLEAFNNADLIAAEDTRRTLQLLNHFEISKPLTSYHEHNKHEKGCFLAMMLAMRIMLRRMRTVKRTSGALSRIYS